VTLIEILLVVGLLVILISFASPTISNATTRTQMQAEAENIQYSIRIARNTARMNEREVGLIVHSGPGAVKHRISFDFSGTAEHRTGLQEYMLDRDFQLASDYTRYEFDSRGIVKNPGKIILSARGDETVSRSFKVE
jgi:Tfp pilus assembly protein FimT